MDLEKLKTRIKDYSYRENHEQLFTLASGSQSPYYFDLKQTLLQPEYLKIAAQCMSSQMREVLGRMPDAVTGLTMGADPLVYSIAVMSVESDHTVFPLPVRKKTKSHGSQKRVEGILDDRIRQGLVVLIDDVITTGGSTLQAWEALSEIGISVQHAFCILDRIEGGADALEKQGVQLHSLFTRADFSEK